MSRIRIVTALAAVLAVALAAVASAAKVTGGTTTITASAAAAKVLTDNGIAVKALAPATQSGRTFTFPIAGGHINSKLRGVIRHRGGIALSNAAGRKVSLRRLTIVATKRGAALWALARGKARSKCGPLMLHGHRIHGCRVVIRWHVVRLARLADVQVSGRQATATVKITRFTARLVNRLAGKHVVNAGATLGTATVAPTF
jgi:hypothetical protein